jgi:hypothetical protein
MVVGSIFPAVALSTVSPLVDVAKLVRYQKTGPERTNPVFGRLFFWWNRGRAEMLARKTVN